jgi:uncharacterized protein YcfJ
MENTSTSNRIHPLMAVAAASVTIASLVGAAAFAGLLPGSKGSVESAPATAAVQGSAPAELSATAPGAVPAPAANALAAQPVAAQPAAAAPAPKQVVHHKTVVHHEYAKPAPVQEAAPQVAQQPAQAPAAAPQNSALGIGIGAVVGGLVGNQVGGGKGRTLATVAGAIGGGYVGNEIAKRNQASSAPEQK